MEDTGKGLLLSLFLFGLMVVICNTTRVNKRRQWIRNNEGHGVIMWHFQHVSSSGGKGYHICCLSVYTTSRHFAHCLHGCGKGTPNLVPDDKLRRRGLLRRPGPGVASPDMAGRKKKGAFPHQAPHMDTGIVRKLGLYVCHEIWGKTQPI